MPPDGFTDIGTDDDAFDDAFGFWPDNAPRPNPTKPAPRPSHPGAAYGVDPVAFADDPFEVEGETAKGDDDHIVLSCYEEGVKREAAERAAELADMTDEEVVDAEINELRNGEDLL